MFGCSNKSLYYLEYAGAIKSFEDALNNTLGQIASRSSLVITYKVPKHLPLCAHYVKIQTKYLIKNADDLKYNSKELGRVLLDSDFCYDVVNSIIGKKSNKKNKEFKFSCVSGRKFGRNYLIVYWR